MTTNELLWFSVSISGFVLFMEASINYILTKLNRKIPEQLARAGAGLFLLILGIIYLFNLPSG